jgi:molybdenum cofactor cytidylyltransferase
MTRRTQGLSGQTPLPTPHSRTSAPSTPYPLPSTPVSILLAAGKSSRMGEPKILLQWQGKTLLENALSALRLLTRGTIAVLPHDLSAAQKIARNQGVTVACGDPEADMLDSLRRGLAAAPPGTPVFVAIGDQPLGPYPWLRQLAGLAALHPGLPLIPMHCGKKGHPVYLPAPLADRLRVEAPADGLRGLLRTLPTNLLETADPRAVLDLDTPEDYKRLLSHLEK